MNEHEMIELDLGQLVQAIWKKAWLIAASAVVCALVALLITKYTMTPMYRADVKMYVNNSSISIGSSSVSISGSELSTAKSLVATYIVILQSRTVLDAIVEEGELPYTSKQLSGMLTASAMDGTEIFKIEIVNPDPMVAQHIGNTVADVLPDKIASIVSGSEVRVVDFAVKPTSSYAPNYTQNTVIGLMIGFILSAMFVILTTILDDSINSDDRLAQEFDIPVLSVVPDVFGEDASQKYGKQYGYYGNRYYRANNGQRGKRTK